jgi:hypothetical protein
MAKIGTTRQRRVDWAEIGENYVVNRLGWTLALLDNVYCWLPGSAPIRNDLLAQNTFWPREWDLEQLHSVVTDLFMTEHGKLPDPYWKAYKWVNDLLPKLRLVRTVDQLVRRARARLNEVGESYLVGLQRDAGAGSPKAKGLVKLLQAIKEDVSKAKEGAWEDYEQLLFKRDNKLVQLACGDLAGNPRLRCYARALEIVADDLRYERMRPFLRWIAYIGYPNPPNVPDDAHTALLAALSKILADWRKKLRTKVRVAQHRLKARPRDEIENWIKAHSSDLMFAGVKEADFLRKVLRGKGVTSFKVVTREGKVREAVSLSESRYRDAT